MVFYLNHESPRRGLNFVTNKIVKGAVDIFYNKEKELLLGNLEAKRDWGHAYDYVRTMHLMLQQNTSSEWVVSTGKSRSVRDVCNYVFGKLGLDYDKYVVQDSKYLRPKELYDLKGDSTKIRTKLGWTPTYTFEDMMDEMIEYWKSVHTKNKEN